MNEFKQENPIRQEEPIDEAVARLIGAVIGSAIQPDKTRRLANGRMNRPEDRGGEGIEWLDTENGQFWLNLADQTGIDTTVIRSIANDPDAYGYEGIGHGAWDVNGHDPLCEKDHNYNNYNFKVHSEEPNDTYQQKRIRDGNSKLKSYSVVEADKLSDYYTGTYPFSG